MPPRFSIWMVLAGVALGVLAGYLTGSGILGDGAPAGRKAPQLREVREEFSKGLEAEERGEMLRSFDEAVRRASRKRD